LILTEQVEVVVIGEAGRIEDALSRGGDMAEGALGSGGLGHVGSRQRLLVGRVEHAQVVGVRVGRAGSLALESEDLGGALVAREERRGHLRVEGSLERVGVLGGAGGGQSSRNGVLVALLEQQRGVSGAEARGDEAVRGGGGGLGRLGGGGALGGGLGRSARLQGGGLRGLALPAGRHALDRARQQQLHVAGVDVGHGVRHGCEKKRERVSGQNKRVTRERKREREGKG